MDTSKIKVLIADDSAIIRGILEKAFNSNPDFRVISTVSNGRKAYDEAKTLMPQLVITDVDMPEMSGLETTKLITDTLKIPVIVISENPEDKIKALANGACAFFEKPNLTKIQKDSFKALLEMAKKHAKKDVSETASTEKTADFEKGSAPRKFSAVLLGASTGGPKAVQKVLSNLGKNFPLPVIYVQHIDAGSDKKMADWFNSVCPDLPLTLVQRDTKAENGKVYMAPADKHLVISGQLSDGTIILSVTDEPEEHFLRPAVNKLFKSGAKILGKTTLAVLLTGMGRDGAEGCLEIIQKGGYTICQNEKTCAVYGMPKAAVELKAIKEILPLEKIAPRLKELCGGSK